MVTRDKMLNIHANPKAAAPLRGLDALIPAMLRSALTGCTAPSTNANSKNDFQTQVEPAA